MYRTSGVNRGPRLALILHIVAQCRSRCFENMLYTSENCVCMREGNRMIGACVIFFYQGPRFDSDHVVESWAVERRIESWQTFRAAKQPAGQASHGDATMR
jgi:hypothetical protein